jgi:hypothetical protein
VTGTIFNHVTKEIMSSVHIFDPRLGWNERWTFCIVLGAGQRILSEERAIIVGGKTLDKSNGRSQDSVYTVELHLSKGS